MAELADFNFDIKYMPGKANVDADTLSLLPLNFEKYMGTVYPGEDTSLN